MKFLKVDSIVAEMLNSPALAEFNQQIYDLPPIGNPDGSFIVLTTISDPTVSQVQNRARLEVRAFFPKETKQFDARAWQGKFDSFFVGSGKEFDGEEVYRIENDGRQLFIDEDLRRVVICDYLFFYLN